MSEKTNISWCDATHNFWEGCAKVSAGCAHCYAEARDKRFTGGTYWGKGAPRRRSKSFEEPLKWNRNPWVCDRCGVAGVPHASDGSCPNCENWQGHRRRVFSLSLGDWLDDEVPIEWLVDMLDVIRRCPNVDFLLLTKRPGNFFPRLSAALNWATNNNGLAVAAAISWWLDGKSPVPFGNVWLGVSVEDQAAADKRIPILLTIPAGVRFLSVEPMLGSVDLSHWLIEGGGGGIDWAIFGGESGHGARPCNVDWIRIGVAQCKYAGVPCFVKQLGAAAVEPDEEHDYRPYPSSGKGDDMAEWLEDLRVREFPVV